MKRIRNLDGEGNCYHLRLEAETAEECAVLTELLPFVRVWSFGIDSCEGFLEIDAVEPRP